MFSLSKETEPKVCLVVCFYEGQRAGNQNNFNQYIKFAKLWLKKYKHNLSRIVFSIAIDNHPNTVLSVEEDGIVYMKRQNRGFSFGGWIDVCKLYTSEFDYYIFCEDDYCFSKDNFDIIMVEQYIKHGSPDYLVNWAENALKSTIGIVSKETALTFQNEGRPIFSQIPDVFNQNQHMYYKHQCMGTFLSLFQKFDFIDYEHNCFPYYDYEYDNVHMYGLDSAITKEENDKRILVCAYQYYKTLFPEEFQ
jgi:hypothetical protein